MLLCFSCKKDKSADPYWGDAMALLNGNIWTPKIYAGANEPYQQGIDILMNKYNDQDFLRQTLFLYKIPKQVGKYPLVENDIRVIDSLTGAEFYTSLEDGDILGDTFILLDNIVDNYVQIDKIEGDQLWGTFQMALIRDGQKSDLSVPDTIIITGGEFHTRIKNPE